MSSPWYFLGPWATALGKFLFTPIAGSACDMISFIISWHSSTVNDVASSGYLSFGIRTCLRLNSAAARGRFAVVIFFFHSVAASLRCCSSAELLPSGVSLTPRVLQASCVSSLGMITC